MPRAGSGTYPNEWKRIARDVKDAADWTCVRCARRHDPSTGYTLTVHHLDLDKSNCRWWNLVALCQRCHLHIQGKLILDRPYVMFEHSEWFRPYVAGYYAWRYLAEELDRETVMLRLNELLALERIAVGRFIALEDAKL